MNALNISYRLCPQRTLGSCFRAHTPLRWMRAVAATPRSGPQRRSAVGGVVSEDFISNGSGEQEAASLVHAFDYGVATSQGPRESMEDEAVVQPNAVEGSLFAAVMDGHGGDFAVTWLAENLYTEIERVMTERKSSAGENGACTVEEALTTAFHEADSKLLRLAEGGGREAGEEGGEEGTEVDVSGATVTVALVNAKRLLVANAGDSRAVLCRQGRAVPLSTDHRVFGWDRMAQQETERVKAAGGWVTDGRVCDVLAVSRALGDYEFKGPGLSKLLLKGIRAKYWDQAFVETVRFTGDPVVSTPAVLEVERSAGDEFVVLATDGLWDCFPEPEVLRYVRKQLGTGKKSVQLIAEEVVLRALRRYTPDNVAVVIIDLRPAGAAAQKRGRRR